MFPLVVVQEHVFIFLSRYSVNVVGVMSLEIYSIGAPINPIYILPEITTVTSIGYWNLCEHISCHVVFTLTDMLLDTNCRKRCENVGAALSRAKRRSFQEGATPTKIKLPLALKLLGVKHYSQQLPISYVSLDVNRRKRSERTTKSVKNEIWAPSTERNSDET